MVDCKKGIWLGANENFHLPDWEQAVLEDRSTIEPIYAVLNSYNLASAELVVRIVKGILMPRRQGVKSLSREQVLEVALKLVDQHGLAALSMRRLGAELGVDPMTIYYHVPGKAALVKALVELVFADFAIECKETSWRAQVRSWAHTYRSLALRHPHLVLEIVSDQEEASIAAQHADVNLKQALAVAHLPEKYQAAGAHVIVDYVNGFVLGEVAIPERADEAFEAGLDLIIAGLEHFATHPAVDS